MHPNDSYAMRMSLLGRKVLAVPGTSTAPERMFSSAGNYYDQAKTGRAVKATHGTQVPS